MTVHADPADVCYSGTLKPKEELASWPVSWAGQDFWTAAHREHSIALREPEVVRILLRRHFADFVSRTDVHKILLHEDN